MKMLEEKLMGTEIMTRW